MSESTEERRRRMRSLLDDFLERPISDVAGPLLGIAVRDAEAIAPDSRIGAYRVIRELGRGGMGVVCLAERGEEGGPVALKILGRELEMDATNQRRFRAERRILASLDHPGIARVFDDGVMADGRPWFAMEYVDGIPIDAYAAVRQLDVAARLELFAKVCDAVEYAHRQSIVHRDIKPSNVLVSVDGVVKLLDFGIAKATALAAGDDIRTRTGEGRLTRDYASPEQLRGQRATAASDVFALGVLLYMLLTGRHPNRRRGLRVLLRSFLGLPPRLGGEFPRELDAIATRALRRKPERRYSTAGALVADVRAFLSRGRTIAALRDAPGRISQR